MNWDVSGMGRENDKSCCDGTYPNVASGLPFTTISGLAPIVALHSSFTNEPHALREILLQKGKKKQHEKYRTGSNPWDGILGR
jgi:hypothetical protein